MLADIPGLIEGAHEGAGIGDRFLGHVERCGVLIHLVDGTEEDVTAAYHDYSRRAGAYERVLAEKPEIVVLNKIDALTDEEIKDKIKVAEEGQQGRGDDVPRASPARASSSALYRRYLDARCREGRSDREPRRAVEPDWSPDEQRARPLRG